MSTRPILGRVRLPAQRYLSEFLYILGNAHRWRLGLIFLAFLFLSNIELIGIALIGSFVSIAFSLDQIQQASVGRFIIEHSGIHDPFQVVAIIGAGVVAMFLFKALSGYYVNRAVVTFAHRHQQQVRTKLVSSYLSLPLERALKRNSSSLILAVQNHAQVFTNRIMIPLLKAIAEAILITLLFIFLLFENTTVALSLALLIGIISALFNTIFRKKLERAGAEAVLAGKRCIGIVSQSSEGIKDIRIAGVAPFFLSEFDHQASRFCRSSIYKASLNVVPRYMLECSIGIFVVGFVLLGLAIYEKPTPEFIATVSVFAVSAVRAMSSASVLLTSLSNLRYGKRALNDLYADLKEAELTLDTASTSAPGRPAGSSHDAMRFEKQVCLETVTYGYPDAAAPALSAVDLCIPKGGSVGIIGSSGAGKTTLVDVLLGLLTPQQGRVTVDKVPIEGRTRSWMDRVAYIPQSVFLIDDTIAANIALGVDSKKVDTNRLQQAVQTAQLHKLVDSLPDKLDTTIGERGARISGGQRQRIAIARAVYHQRDLLVMDEATAALDNETENDVVEAIRELHGKVTLVVIAHRITTLRYCDTVVRVERGRIIESGSFQDLTLLGSNSIPSPLAQ